MKAYDKQEPLSDLEALQILALREVYQQSPEYVFRKIFRWYSKNFATPLHVVGTLPIDDVITAFFESIYEDMDSEELDKVRLQLLETPAAKEERLLQEERERLQAFRSSKLLEEQAAQDVNDPAAMAKLQEALKKMAQPLSPAQGQAATVAPVKVQPETELPIVPEIKEGVTFTFLDPAELEERLEE